MLNEDNFHTPYNPPERPQEPVCAPRTPEPSQRLMEAHRVLQTTSGWRHPIRWWRATKELADAITEIPHPEVEPVGISEEEIQAAIKNSTDWIR